MAPKNKSKEVGVRETLIAGLIIFSAMTWIPWLIGIVISPYVWPEYYDSSTQL
jgi:type IV secretory pathway TrbD component